MLLIGLPLTIALGLVAEEIGIGLAVNVGLSVVGHRVIRAAADRGWLEEPWTQLPVVSLAFTCFAVAQAAGGSGFIACFTGGLAFGGLVKSHKEQLFERAEGSGNILSLLGLGVHADAQLFLGWFGPRGLASIVFGVIVVGQNVTGSGTLAPRWSAPSR